MLQIIWYHLWDPTGGTLSRGDTRKQRYQNPILDLILPWNIYLCEHMFTWEWRYYFLPLRCLEDEKGIQKGSADSAQFLFLPSRVFESHVPTGEPRLDSSNLLGQTPLLKWEQGSSAEILP